ncbi:intron Large complex component GCFC2 [Bombina bombina]|uniref:intron Large complex component GCFC2 n=1 Tax=Bombina bombina TaxID=8345 RepID=UPI00235B1F6F|nr:intron Large complex component GCFC2 [Bombina bombina]
MLVGRMFKKPKRSFRGRKAESSDEEREEEDETTGQSFNSRHRRPERRGITCGTRKEGQTTAEREKPGADSEEEPDSESEEIAEPNALPRTHHPLLSFTGDDKEDNASFKIKRPTVNAVVFKVQKNTENGGSTAQPEAKDSPESNSSSDSESNKPEGNSSSDDDSSCSASSTPGPSPPTLSSTDEIPDAKTIRAARRKRVLARRQVDYISLDASHNGSNSSQSDSSDEYDDHEKRREFAPGIKTTREQMIEETHNLVSDSESDGDENQENVELQDQWEEQQIRKAVKFPQAMEEDFPEQQKPVRVKRSIEPKLTLPSITMEDIRRKLVSRLTTYQEVHRSHEQENEKFTLDLENSKSSINNLEKATSELSYKFFKQMKTFVENFIDCMNEKIVVINKLESAMFKLFQNRARTLLKRRQDDLRSESAALQKMSGNEMPDNVTQKLLEHCKLRRDIRQKIREDSGNEDHYEGMSTDDEMPSDEEETFQEHRDNLSLQLKNLFEDVHEDFHQITNILSRFQEWRNKFSESYYDAYISLCLHKLLSPLIRVQLMDWNPLHNAIDLGQMEWYHNLEEFCCSNDSPEINIKDSADHKVLTSVIEKTLIPKVAGFVEQVWDPLSSVQTDNLVKLCKTYIIENETSTAVKGFIDCIVSRLRKAIEDDVFIPLYSKSVLEDKMLPHSRFQDRQFWSAVKMLRNVLSWDGFLEETTLQELGLDKLLNRYLLLVLLNTQPGVECVNKCSKVVECLPQSWFRGLQSGSSIPRLANFSKHILQCVHALHKTNERHHMEILVSLLMKIKAFDYAEELVKQYSLEGISCKVNF